MESLFDENLFLQLKQLAPLGAFVSVIIVALSQGSKFLSYLTSTYHHRRRFLKLRLNSINSLLAWKEYIENCDLSDEGQREGAYQAAVWLVSELPRFSQILSSSLPLFPTKHYSRFIQLAATSTSLHTNITGLVAEDILERLKTHTVKLAGGEDEITLLEGVEVIAEMFRNIVVRFGITPAYREKISENARAAAKHLTTGDLKVMKAAP